MKKLVLSLIFFSLFMTGCGPEVLIGPAINFFLVWKEGEAHKCYRHDSATVYRAAKRALREMDISIVEDEDNAGPNYYFIAGENDRFKVSIDRIEDKISRLSVRINFMGDKQYAELFYQKVDEELDTIQFDPDGRPRRKADLLDVGSN